MKNLYRSIAASLCLIFAVVLLVLSINTFDLKVDVSYEFEQYGGDAYTGIQNAAAATAVRTSRVNNTIAYVGGSVLLMGAFAFFAASVWMGARGVEDSQASRKDSTEHQYRQQTLGATIPANYKRCPKCGNRVGMNDKHCGSCGCDLKGATTQTNTDSWTCTCGKVNPKYLVTCSCGKSAREVREMSKATHRWLCDGCGKMREKTPCEHCGKE